MIPVNFSKKINCQLKPRENDTLVKGQNISSLFKINKPISDKILSHIQADFYIADAPDQEGNQFESSFEAMIYYLNELPKELMTSALQQLTKDFERCYVLIQKENEYIKCGTDSAYKTTQMILSDIESLECGQRYLFLGGWDASGLGAMGHAMIHVITKQDDGCYTESVSKVGPGLRQSPGVEIPASGSYVPNIDPLVGTQPREISRSPGPTFETLSVYTLMTFNTGNGLNAFHPYQVDNQGYRRYQPVVIYKNITKNNLFNFSHLLSLIDLRHSPLDKGDARYGAEIIYDSILPAFGGEALHPSSDQIQAMRAQRAGTCSWKVLNALIKEVVDPKCYKSIKIHFRLQNLKDYLNNKLAMKTPLTPSQELHVTNDLEKFVRELKKETLGLSTEQLENYFAEVENLKTIKQKLTLLVPATNLQSRTILPLSSHAVHFIEMEIFPQPLANLTMTAEKLNPRIEVTLSTKCPEKTKVLMHLEQALSLSQKLYLNAQYHDVIFSVNTVIQNLPFPIEHVENKKDHDKFWGEYGDRKDEEIFKIINVLAQLNEVLFQSCFHIQKGHGDEIVTAMSSYCMQIKLLENLFAFVRTTSGRGLLGLSGRFAHEANSSHITVAIQANAFAHHPELQSRAHQCANFLECGCSFTTIVDLLSCRQSNNIECTISQIKDIEKLNSLQEEIKKTAWNKEIKRKLSPKDIEFLTENYKIPSELISQSIDYSLLDALIYSDIGQFKIAPEFISSLNKQMFITSYFLGNQDFAVRGQGCGAPDAFTLETHRQETIQPKQFPEIWVKGAIQKMTYATHTPNKISNKTYDKITNQDLRKLLVTILENRKFTNYINPNHALTQYSSFKELPSVDAQELITLANTPSNLMLWQVVAFFHKSIDKLQSPDYQLLFELCVFPSLEEEIQSNPQFAKQFISFILSSIDEFKAPSQIDPFLFLIRIGMHVEAVLKREGFDWLYMLRERLERSENEQEKKAIIAQIAYTLVTKSCEVSLENVQVIIQGLSYLQTNQVPASMMELKILRPVMQWLHEHDRKIHALLQSPDSATILCNTIAHTISEEQTFVLEKGKEALKRDSWQEKQFPIYENLDNQLRVNILTGQAHLKNAQSIYLPRDILENPTFRNLFSNRNIKARVEAYKRFYFTENQREFRIEKLQSGEVVIEQKKKDRWYRYLPKTSLPKDLPLTMIETYTHWICISSLDDRELLIQDSHFNHCFLAKQSLSHGSFIIHPNENLEKKLTSEHLFLQKTFYLAAFEYPNRIRGWSDSSGTVCEIDIPRYGLHFNLEKRSKQPSVYTESISKVGPGVRQSPGPTFETLSVYACKEFEGYSISCEQDLSNLPFVTSYLILDNEKGKKMMLLPLDSLKVIFSSEHFLKGQVHFKKDKPFSYLKIDLTCNKEPKNLNAKQALYLAYLALTQKNYTDSDRFLTIAENLPPDEIENEVYKFLYIVENNDPFLGCKPDNHPKAKALALRAGILLLKDMRYRYQSSDPAAQKEISALLNDLHKIYRKYHAADFNAGYMLLSLTDERLALQEFFNHRLLELDEFDRLLYLQSGSELKMDQRKADGLKKDAHISLEEELQEPIVWSNLRKNLENWIHSAQIDVWNGKKNLIDQPLTRPRSNFIPYFIHVCLDIKGYRTNPEKKEELAYYLQLIKWTVSGNFFRECLLDVLQHSEQYTIPLEELQVLSKNKADASQWMLNIADIFHRRFKNKKLDKSLNLAFPKKVPLEILNHPASFGIGHKDTLTKTCLWDDENLSALFDTHSTKSELNLANLDDQSNHLENHHRHQISEFNRAKTKFYEKDQSIVSYHLKDPGQLKMTLKEALKIGKQRLKLQEDALLKLANSLPRDPEKMLELKMDDAGNQRKELTLNDLFFLYLHESEKDILKHCPGFENNPKYCKTLLNSIGKYLILATEQQQRKRTFVKLKELQDLQKKQQETPDDVALKKEVANVTTELHSIMSAQRVEGVSSHPVWLLFEFKSNILMRKKQVEVLSQLIDSKTEAKDPSETEVVVQLIMGEGKSKVIAPLLATKRADGEKLSLLIQPNSLYETSRRDSKQIAKNTLQPEPISFDFNRNTPFTEEELRNKLWSLQNAILQRQYVVTTAESLLCLKLKYREILHQIGQGQLKSNEVETKHKLLFEIIKLIKTKGWALLDEADVILDDRREVNFPVGAYKSTPKEYTQLIQKIYEVLLNPKMSPWVPIRNNKPETFSKEDFLTHVAPIIIDHLIKDWNLEGIQQEDLRKYLLGQLKTEELSGLHDKHLLKDQIALAKEMITLFIPAVLRQKGNLNFGLSHETNAKYPIPYKGKDTPEESSEFGNIYETLLYAASIYFQCGLKPIHIDELIQQTCQKIRLESKDRNCRYAQTPSFQKFVQIYGIKDPFAITPKDKEILSEAVKLKHEALFHWLQHFVYPEIRTTDQKINANAMTLIDMLAHVQGFTGTPWNKLTYHDRLNKPQRDDALSFAETELRILHTIYQKVKEGGLHACAANTPKEVLNKILTDFEFDCLIEVGALLNGITNSEVSAEIMAKAKNKDLKGVIYFNENNELCVQLKGIDQAIPYVKATPDGLISYYDQRHTTGTDIDQRSTAKALLTFSNNMIRDLTQGSMRMRKLLSSQEIEILIPVEIKNQLIAPGEKLTFEALLQYALIQQANRLGDGIIRATKMKLHHIMRYQIDNLIMAQENIDIQVKLSQFFEAIMTDLCANTPYQAFGTCFKLEDTLKVLTDYQQKQIDLISNLMSKEALEQLCQSTSIYTESVSKVGPGLRQSPGVEIPASGSYVPNIDPLAGTQPREISRSPGPTFETLSVYTESVFSKVGPGLRQSPGVEIPASGSYVPNIDPLAGTQPRELVLQPGPTFETLSVYEYLVETKKCILEKLNSFSMPNKALLPQKTARENPGQAKNDSKVEVQKEIEMQVESQIQCLHHKSADYSLWGKYKAPVLDALFFTPHRIDPPKHCPIFLTVNSLLPNREIFEKDLYTSQLFINSVEDQKDPLFGSGSQKHNDQLVFVVEPDGSTKGIIVDPAEAAMIRKHMAADQLEKRKIHLIDLHTGFTCEKGGVLNELEKEKFALFQVQAKFFNGEIAYTKNEWKHMNAWISLHDKKIFREMFEKIASSYLGQYEKYLKSTLKSVLNT